MPTALEQNGFEIIENVFGAEEADTLAKAISGFFQANEQSGKRGGIRNLLRCRAVAELSRSNLLRSIVKSSLGASAFPVRGIFFDKTPDANWLVTWHQDVSIAVAERCEVNDFGPWSVKDGVPHVQPPREILERMLTLRLHLDDCNEGNGALKVFLGSHQHGKLDSTEIEKWKQRSSPVTCNVAKGGVLVMKPLLLHSSSPATSPSHRRVVHIEYTAEKLPGGLRWFETAPSDVN